MALTERHGISIAQLVIYIPTLIIGILLCIRHGFGRNAGFFFLIIFSLARALGAALDLATLAQPHNLSIYFGAFTLQSIGLAPLILMLLALDNRVLAQVERVTTIPVSSRQVRFVNLILLVALILSSIGGSDSGNAYADTGVYTVSDLTKAGIALTIVGFGILALLTIAIAFNVSHVEAGEKRVLLAVVASLPFLLVRLIYSGESVFGHNPNFSPLNGNTNLYLGTAVIEEIIIVVIVEAMGLTLKVLPKPSGASQSSSSGLLGGIGSRFGRRFEGSQRQSYLMEDRRRDDARV
ncbi:hypothetical protein GGR57DRAFT_484931 [Xylariaceae sp. FL1272]|nr:hypothetical protein GGR57DRAFT_484931 [Xylariaceae sp. FL1272]